MFNLGFSELIILGIIALVFIGPNQLPEVARTLGRLLNEWKRATSDFQNTITTQITDEVQGRIQDSRGEHQHDQDHAHLQDGMGDQMISDHEVAQRPEREPAGHESELPVGATPVEKDKKS